ncbi:MAG: phage terminase large subunit [Clostridia bacterium]|nr:phage terminase large subunit [Clostridia bacterium]
MPNSKGKKGRPVKIKLSGTPQKKQMLFFLSKAKYVAYGGARGGGKSWALRRKLVLMCARFPGINVLLIRRTYPELRDNHIRPLLSELKDIAQYNDTRKTFDFPNGSRIKLGYLDSENDTYQYQGQEYDVIAIDEATQLTEFQFQTLKACLRGANSFPKRMYLTCNPGGVGHGWVKRLFIDKEYRRGERKEDYDFIPAKVYDNKILLDKNPDYLEQLKSLPAGLREAWLDGSWNGFEGQFFREFDYDIHTVPREAFCDGTYRRYCAIDYGLDMLAAVFVAVDKDGRATVYDEVHKSGLIVSEAAREILKKADGVGTFIAPSDLWSRQKDSGKSIAEIFSENGIYLTKLTSERVAGWVALKEWLNPKKRENGISEPDMKITRNCENLIRCMQLLLYDEQKPADAAKYPHNVTHAPDALRYFAVFRSARAHADSIHTVKLTEKIRQGYAMRKI